MKCLRTLYSLFTKQMSKQNRHMGLPSTFFICAYPYLSIQLSLNFLFSLSTLRLFCFECNMFLSKLLSGLPPTVLTAVLRVTKWHKVPFFFFFSLMAGDNQQYGALPPPPVRIVNYMSCLQFSHSFFEFNLIFSIIEVNGEWTGSK